MSGPPGVPPRLLLRQTSMIRALATSDDVRSKEPPLSFRERLLTLLRNWLACPDPLQQADRIFVLAGRRYRKSYGVNLLQQGWARGILLSTLSGDSLDLSRFAELHLPHGLASWSCKAVFRRREGSFFSITTVPRGAP